jgi:hypothetical protein
MKKFLVLLMGALAPYFSIAQETQTEVEASADIALWQNIFNWSVIGISILLAIFLLLGLREIRRTFIPG